MSSAPKARNLRRYSAAMKLKFAAPLLACILGAGCALPPVVHGPGDLDTESAAAPRCAAQTYPFHSLENGEEGVVLVRAQVDTQGRVANARLLDAADSGFLNDASLQAVRGCRFAPGHERAVNVTVVWALIGGFELPTGVVRIGVQASRQSP